MQTLHRHSTSWHHLMVIIGFALCGTITSYAQEVKGDTLTTEGKEFLVLFIENGKNKAETGSSRTDLDLYFSSRQDATVTIQNSSSKDVKSITKGTIGTLHVNSKNAYVRKENINTVSEKGLFVTSTAPICLYALSVGGASTDASCILPVTALGKDYVLQSYDANRSGTSSDKNIYGGMFAIMAAEDNTVVQITPSVELQNHAANTTFSVTLNRGESYFCKAKGETDKSICGTRVTSNKKVAVFQGNNSCTVQKSQSAYDHNYEQATPTTMLGDTFALVKISEAFDMVRFTALYDNTNVYVNGTKQTTINALNTYEYKLSQDECFVVSSKPVVCNSFLCGVSNNKATNLGDPSMVVNPPIEQMIDTCTFISTTSSNSLITKFYVNIVTYASSKAAIQLDGSPIDANQFTTFSGNSKFVYSRQELTNGVHTLTGDGCRFMATVFGLGEAESYAYSAGCSAIPIVPEEKIDTFASSCEAVLPYKWRKYDNITLTGLYPDTVKSGKIGVPDTITTLHFTVHYSVETTKDTTVCSNDLPVDWQGFQWTGEDVHNKSLTTIHGCDSLVTLYLFVNEPSDTTYRDTTICKNDLPYNWEGWTWYGAGTKYKELANKAKCDSVVKATVKVAEPYSATFNKAICPAQLPYTWDELTWTQAGTQTKYLQTTIGCDSTVTYVLDVKSYSTGKKDTTVCNNDLPVTWEGFTWTGADTKSKTLVNSVGCDSIVTLSLTVKMSSKGTKDTTICYNDLPISWEGYTWNDAGTKTKTLTNAVGCDSIVTLTLQTSKAPQSAAIEAITLCNGESYPWHGQTYTQAGTYYYTLKTKTGCDSVYYTLQITTGKDQTSTTTLSVSIADLPYMWNGVKCDKAGQFIAHLPTSLGCDSTAILNLTTFVSPVGAVVDNVCADDSIAIINILYNGTPPDYTYSLQWDAFAHENGFVDLQTTQSAKVETIHVVLPVQSGKAYTRPNHYIAQLIMQAEGIQTQKDIFDIGFDVLYPSWILKQKWDDVLGVLNAGYNDGYQFNQYMWFKDNVQLPEYTTDILYRKGGLLPGDYQAKVTRMDDGISMLTCSKTVAAPPASPAREVSIYPTVVNASQPIVHLNSYMSGTYTIYNSLGHIVQQGAIGEGDNSISLSDLHTGIVIISYTLDNQETKNTKISIRP